VFDSVIVVTDRLVLDSSFRTQSINLNTVRVWCRRSTKIRDNLPRRWQAVCLLSSPHSKSSLSCRGSY